MDLRVTKTQRAIRAAFLELREKKPLEKITVKELCQRAEIHKSTFYDHYADVYALSDALETQVVESVLQGLTHPEYLFEQPELFTRELFAAYRSQGALIHLLFSGSRSGNLVAKIERAVKELAFARYPAGGPGGQHRPELRHLRGLLRLRGKPALRRGAGGGGGGPGQPGHPPDAPGEIPAEARGVNTSLFWKNMVF